MHGSIDWFEEIHQCDSRRYDYQNANIYPVSVGKRFGAQKILSTEETSDDPLCRIFRIRDLNGYFSQGTMSKDIPLVFPPSHQKLIYLAPLLENWRAFSDNDFVKRVVIIGYSLPSHDQYVQIALYHLVAGKQCKVVDFQQTLEDIELFRKNYRFFDWDNNECYFDGFNMEAINMIFAK